MELAKAAVSAKLYYCGINNLNYSAVQASFKESYAVDLISNENTEVHVNCKVPVAAVLLDIDSIGVIDCHRLIDFFCKKLPKKPPFVVITNNCVIDLSEFSEVTDVIKIVNVTQIRNKFEVLKHKVNWYREQCLNLSASQYGTTEKLGPEIGAQRTNLLSQDQIEVRYHSGSR